MLTSEKSKTPVPHFHLLLRASRTGKLAAGALICVLAVLPHAGEIDFSPGLLRYAAKQWGDLAPMRLFDWQQQVRKLQAGTASARDEQYFLQQVNSFWNKTPYLEDQAHWASPDYWATPVETKGSNGGDCEDYVFGKYFTLKELGIPVRKLRITYVKATDTKEPHMVLAYYPQPEADPLILDNLIGAILPASKRTDLQPVYSFNHDDSWMSQGIVKRQPSELRLWRELLDKMVKERQM